MPSETVEFKSASFFRSTRHDCRIDSGAPVSGPADHVRRLPPQEEVGARFRQARQVPRQGGLQEGFGQGHLRMKDSEPFPAFSRRQFLT